MKVDPLIDWLAKAIAEAYLRDQKRDDDEGNRVHESID